MKTLVALSLLFSFWMHLPDPGWAQTQSDAKNIDALIDKLQHPRSVVRHGAAIKLVEIGGPAVEPLFDFLIHRDTTVDGQKRTATILLKIARQGDKKVKDATRKRLQKIDLAKFRRIKTELLRLRTEVFGVMHMSEQDAITRLTKAGCQIAILKMAHCDFRFWKGNVDDFQCLHAIKRPIYLGLPVELEEKFYELLPGIKLNTIHMHRSRQILDEGPIQKAYVTLNQKRCAALSKCVHVQTLNMFNVYLSENTDFKLGNMSALTDLMLPANPSNKLLHELGKLKKLQKLRFSGMPSIKGDGLSSLKDHPSLEYLNLNQCEIDRAEQLEFLSTLKKLTYLQSPQFTANDQTMKYICQIPRLERLYLDTTLVTDRGFSHVKNLKTLTSLQVFRTSITDRSIPIVAELPKLTKFYSKNTLITKAGNDKLKDRLKAKGKLRSFEVSPSDYELIQNSLDVGLVLRRASSRNYTLRAYIFERAWNGKPNDISKLKKLKINQVWLRIKMKDDMLKALLELDGDIPIRIHRSCCTKTQLKKVQDHFKDVTLW